MKDCTIYCVEFLGNDNKWHQETAWHTDRKYCEHYIETATNPEILRLTYSNLFFD